MRVKERKREEISVRGYVWEMSAEDECGRGKETREGRTKREMRERKALNHHI